LKPFDANGLFRTSVGTNRLRRVAIRGAGVNVLAESGTYVVQLAGVMVLARLLVPADFGLVTVVTTVSVFLATILRIGFPEAILQREKMNHHVASNVFWIIVGISVLLALGFVVSGPILAKIYADPRISRIVSVTSLSIFFTGTSVVHLALLDRSMCFVTQSAIKISSRILAVTTSVLLAWAGWGYWALVGGVIVESLVYSISGWLFCRWVPGLPRRVEGTEPLVSFAMHVSGATNINYWTRNIDNLLVGWRFGAAPLGFYKKAYDLFVLPVNQFFSTFPVAITTLSRLAHDPVQYRRHFLAGLSALALVGMGAAGVLTFVGRDLVRLILGPAWGTAGLIFTYFAPGIGILLIYKATVMIHLSIGTPARYLRWTIVELVVTGALFLVALPWGPTGVAVAWTASFWILCIPGFRYAGKPIQLEVAAVVRSTWRYFAASLLAGCGCAFFLRHARFLAELPNWSGALVRLMATSSVFLALYLVGVILVHRGNAPLREFAGLVREAISTDDARLEEPDQAGISGEGTAVTTDSTALRDTA
jgi:O-antigen/teichoic acid export membrane protein